MEDYDEIRSNLGGSVKFGRDKYRSRHKSASSRAGKTLRSGVTETAYSSRDVDEIVGDAVNRERDTVQLTEGQQKTLRHSTA